jgi:hypothetical protein
MPLFEVIHVSAGVDFFVAVLIGIVMGVALEQGGFGNSRKMSAMFFFKDMTVFKVMFTAIAIAMTGMTFFRLIGVLNYDAVYLNPSIIVPGIIGGLIMGMGFVLGGYCPGTSFAGIVSLKYDAMFYMGGIFIGMFAFGETEVLWADVFHKDGAYSGFMGNRVTLDGFFHIPYWLVTIIVIVIAVAGMKWAESIEKKRGEIVQPNGIE